MNPHQNRFPPVFPNGLQPAMNPRGVPPNFSRPPPHVASPSRFPPSFTQPPPGVNAFNTFPHSQGGLFGGNNGNCKNFGNNRNGGNSGFNTMKDNGNNFGQNRFNNKRPDNNRSNSRPHNKNNNNNNQNRFNGNNFSGINSSFNNGTQVKRIDAGNSFINPPQKVFNSNSAPPIQNQNLPTANISQRNNNCPVRLDNNQFASPPPFNHQNMLARPPPPMLGNSNNLHINPAAPPPVFSPNRFPFNNPGQQPPASRGRGGWGGGRGGRGGFQGNNNNNKGNNRGGSVGQNHQGNKRNHGVPNKRDLAENNNFFCDTCDRGFKDEDKYKEHIAEHIKCSHKDCPYIAAPKLVKVHIALQHKSGLAKKVWSVESQDDINKWREERKRKFPTTENIAKKKQDQEDRIARGEVLETKNFSCMRGGSRDQSRGRGRNNNQRTRREEKRRDRRREHKRVQMLGHVDHDMPEDDAKTKTAQIKEKKDKKDGSDDSSDDSDDDGPPEEAKLDRPLETIVIDLEESEDCSVEVTAGKKRKTESATIVVGSEEEEFDTPSPEKLTEERQARKDSVIESGPPNTSSLGLLASYSISSSGEEDDDGDASALLEVTTKLTPDDCQPSPTKRTKLESNSHKKTIDKVKKHFKSNEDKQLCVNSTSEDEAMDTCQIIEGKTKSDDDSPPSENRIMRNGNKAGDSPEDAEETDVKTKKWNKRERPNKNNKRKGRQQAAQQREYKYTLLEKILAPDIRQERNKILQCVHYIVKNKFFDK